MRKIFILLVGMVSCNFINGQTLKITDAVTGNTFKPSDNVTFTRTISYTNIFKYEKAPEDSQNAGRFEKVFYPDRQNCIVESFKYLGPEYEYKFKKGDPELENIAPNGLRDYNFDKKIIISISAPGYEKGTIIYSSQNYIIDGRSYSKSYSHIKLVPLN